MKQFKIIFAGDRVYMADSEKQAIGYAEKDLPNIPASFNVGIFAVSEVKDDE
jgi:hypothetical protein